MDEDDEISEVDAGAVLFNRDDGLPQDTPRFRIGVAQCSDDSWRHKMNDEILREAMFYNGVSVEIRSAGDDNTKQAEDVHYFMDEGVDLLIISANEAAPMNSDCRRSLSERHPRYSCRPEDSFG